MLRVHFDFVRIGNDVEVGALVLHKGEVVDSKLELYRDIGDRGNNLHFSILAWITGIKLLEEYLSAENKFRGSVTFCNQNELIFRWAEKGNYPAGYAEGIEKLYYIVLQFHKKFNVNFAFTKISSKANKVKVLLNRRKKHKESKKKEKLTFNHRLSTGEFNFSEDEEKRGSVFSHLNESKSVGKDVDQYDGNEDTSSKKDNVIDLFNTGDVG